MRVRFRNPESREPQQDRHIGFDMAPARRPQVPGWRWYVLVLFVATPLLAIAVRLLVETLSLKGSGYLIFPRIELTASMAGHVDKVMTHDGAAVKARFPLLQLRVTAPARLAGSDGTPTDQAEWTVSAPQEGLVERIWVQAGQPVSVSSRLLSLRTGTIPFVQAWMDARYLDRLWPGRPAQVRLPDGRWLSAVISQVLDSTEPLPQGLPVPGGGRSSLVVRLRLDEGLPTPGVNYLPVEVRLRWRDDVARWRQ